MAPPTQTLAPNTQRPRNVCHPHPTRTTDTTLGANDGAYTNRGCDWDWWDWGWEGKCGPIGLPP